MNSPCFSKKEIEMVNALDFNERFLKMIIIRLRKARDMWGIPNKAKQQHVTKKATGLISKDEWL